MKRSFADILQDLDGDRARRVARKLPEWAAADAEIPTALALEQCSSSATALYKAHLAGQAAAAAKLRASRYPSQPDGWAPPVHDATGGTVLRAALPAPAEPCREDMSEAKAPSGAATESQRDFRPEVEATESPDEVGNAPFIGGSAKRWGFGEINPPVRSILDLTGGLGVDSWAFSQVAERVVYFERDAELAEAAKRNFARLGADNIDVRCETVTPETDLPEADLIYADPARRDAAGRKVFLLEDCTPDILTLLPLLLQKAPAVLLKLSPMADLSMLADRLGPALREIHVVELDGEVKELLCLLLRDNPSLEPEIVVARTDSLRFRMTEEREASAVYAAGVQPGDVLLEPCPALLKAGAFRLPCERWGLLKLAPSTHLYLSPEAEEAPGAPANRFFKSWRVREVLPLGAAAFKELRKRCPRAEVTARNLPLGSDALRKKLGIAPGGDTHIFGCRLADGRAVLIVTD